MCCYGDKCLLCIDVKKGCLICAIILAFGTGITLIVSFILGCLSANKVIFSHCHSYNNGGSYEYECYADINITVAMYMLALSSAIGLAFVTVLCNGISKRHPGQVKAYFIYGVVAVVLAALAAFVLLLCGQGLLSFVIVFIFVPYSLFLVLVQQTYFRQQVENGAVLKARDLMQI